MTAFTYEILEKLACLSISASGWRKELRVVDWAGRGPRYDLREWAPGDTKASRGITLSLREMRVLQDVLLETKLPDLPDTDSNAGGAAGEEG